MRDDPLETFEEIVQNLVDDQNLQERMMGLIENLHKDIQIRDKTILCLENNIQKLMSIDTFGITSKYAALQEGQAALRTKIKDLENTVDDLNTQIIGKDVEIQKMLTEKENEMKEKIKQKDEELRAVQEKVQELHTEMEAASVFSTVQLEQVEANYKEQLADINKKFKDCLHTCNILRTELYNTKEKCNEYKRKIVNMKHGAELQNSHNFQNQDVNLNSTCSSSIYEFPLDSNNKYPPLEISHNIITTDSSTVTANNNSEPVAVGKLVETKRPPVYRGGNTGGTGFWRERPGNSKNRNTFPPLFPLHSNNNNKENRPSIKKRKLFNPDDLSYLDNEVEEDVIP